MNHATLSENLHHHCRTMNITGPFFNPQAIPQMGGGGSSSGGPLPMGPTVQASAGGAWLPPWVTGCAWQGGCIASQVQRSHASWPNSDVYSSSPAQIYDPREGLYSQMTPAAGTSTALPNLVRSFISPTQIYDPRKGLYDQMAHAAGDWSSWSPEDGELMETQGALLLLPCSGGGRMHAQAGGLGAATASCQRGICNLTEWQPSPCHARYARSSVVQHDSHTDQHGLLSSHSWSHWSALHSHLRSCLSLCGAVIWCDKNGTLISLMSNSTEPVVTLGGARTALPGCKYAVLGRRCLAAARSARHTTYPPGCPSYLPAARWVMPPCSAVCPHATLLPQTSGCCLWPCAPCSCCWGPPIVRIWTTQLSMKPTGCAAPTGPWR